MLHSPHIVLEEFKISRRNGFLPDEQPLRCLPDPYYSPWENIMSDLPVILRGQNIRTRVDNMPTLSVSKLQSEREWQRAYVILSFLTHGYIWGGDSPSEILPPTISCPFLAVANHLELPTTATYAGLNLWNFASVNPGDDLCQPDNLTSLQTFTGTTDEAWFYLISVAMEARGGAIIPTLLQAVQHIERNDSIAAAASLLALAVCIHELGILLERMYEKCDPKVFYFQIRPFLAGSKNMATAGLPRGVFYDEGNGNGRWREYSGGSNSQSSLIQLFDAVLGVEHHESGQKQSRGASSSVFLQEMRRYMPGPHARFLELMSTKTIRNYVLTFDAGHPITTAYNDAVANLTEFRNKHIQIVTRYVILPSRIPLKDRALHLGVNLASASLKTESDVAEEKQEYYGTGGTTLLPFLKLTRDETRSTATSST